jgi:hypothetical protein
MLVKCVCSGCSHSYLADDQSGALACPRCGLENPGSRAAPDFQVEAGGRDEMFESTSFYEGHEVRFAPLAPPAMYVTGDRLLKGLLLGAIVTFALGAVLGGAQAAVQVALPGLAGIALGLVGGLGCRLGLGGRSAGRTIGRTGFVVALALVAGFAGVLAGAWAVERYTGVADRDLNGETDVGQTRSDLDKGLRALVRERSRTTDAGAAALLDLRITEAERLKHLSDAEIEDFLWTQQAGIGQPLAAYAKLRVLHGPSVKLGPGNDPVELPEHVPLAILGGEFLLALILAVRGVMPR